jgi:hypothetical protein
MSASVRIDSGIAAGTNYWIDRPVLRVGSDPQCEICLPSADLAPHALTVEFRGGAYRAYNRGAAPVSVGSTLLQPGAAGNWDEGDAVSLPGGLRLVLSFDGDPRPCPRPEAVLDDGFDVEVAAAAPAATAATTEAAKKAKSKSLMQIAVIGLCLAATGGLLLLMNSGSPEPPAETVMPFDTIVQLSLAKDENIRTIVQKLQYAQSFLVRGDRARAKLHFSNLRDQLLRQIDSLPEKDKKAGEVIKRYVERQLGQLQ